jgi:PAS domain S-box-containing protein
MDRRFALQTQETNERFHQIAENLPFVLALANADFSELLYVNQAYQQIWDRTLESFYAEPMSFLQGIHAEDRGRVAERVQRLISGELIDNLECRVVRPDGLIYWVACRGYPIRDSQGRVYRLVGSARDITQRKVAEEELRRISGQLLRLQDEERRRIARELHDSTGQDLVALATMIGQLNSATPSDWQESRALFSACQELIDHCIREVRTLSYVLHPQVLDEAGLEEAIFDYVEGFTRRSGIKTDLELSSRLGRMSRDIELAVFRVVQESLSNILRHSGSQHAKIRIERDSNLTLEVSDDGHGIFCNCRRDKDGAMSEVGVGIPSMKERIKLVGGQLDMDSNSKGTTVRVTIPLLGG